MATQIQLRRDTEVNWTTNNTILAQGEIGIDLDNKYFKIGDGITAWNSLEIARNGQDVLYDNTIVDRLASVNYQEALDELAVEHAPVKSGNIALTYTNGLITSKVDYWEDGTTEKVRKTYSYDGNGLITGIVEAYKDNIGVTIKTVTSTLTYSGGVVVSISKVVS